MEKLAKELQKVAKRLDTNSGSKADKTRAQEPLQLDSEVRDILLTLRESISALISLSEEAKETAEEVSHLKGRLRVQEDYSEHHHQRSLRGKFFVTFPENNPCPSEKELAEKGKSVLEYTCSLLKEKYGVESLPENFKTCHLTKKGLIFRLILLSPGSPYSKLVHAIKNGIGKDQKTHYINFSLTPRRSSLLYDLRSYRKELKIERFYADADGTLSFMLNAKDNKTRITSNNIKNDNSFDIRTHTNEELRKIFYPGEEIQDELQVPPRTRGRPPKSRFTSSTSSTTPSTQ